MFSSSHDEVTIYGGGIKHTGSKGEYRSNSLSQSVDSSQVLGNKHSKKPVTI